MLPCAESHYSTALEKGLHLPLRFSTLMLSITAPKSTSEEGTEMVFTDAGLEVIVMVADMMSDVYCYWVCVLCECKSYFVIEVF